jgi:MFS family permease
MITSDDRAAMDRAVAYLINQYSPKGRYIGWVMLASILVESWDLYGIGFVLVFIRETFHPSAALLGLAAAGTQGGAVIGALIGGWLADKIGRRAIFLSTMIMFMVFALAQAFVPNIGWLIVVRLILGIPLGSDISNGYTYIMEVLPKGKREVVGNRWQFIFALGNFLSPVFVVVFLLSHVPHEVIWRVMLGLGAVPAAVVFLLRRRLPETAVWLIRHGRFQEAKEVAVNLYGDSLDMLPNRDIQIAKPRPSAFLADLRKDTFRLRATIFGWIACAAEGSEFSTFGFYVPVLFVLIGVSSLVGNYLFFAVQALIGMAAGWVGPLVLPRIGHRGLSISGFSIVLISLLVCAFALQTNNLLLLPFAVATMTWGHNWDAQNCVTIPAMMAYPEYRGTATGFAYIFVKFPSFLAIFLFPVIFSAVGKVNSTLLVAVFPLLGLLAAIVILPEVYGYDGDRASSHELGGNAQDSLVLRGNRLSSPGQ